MMAYYVQVNSHMCTKKQAGWQKLATPRSSYPEVKFYCIEANYGKGIDTISADKKYRYPPFIKSV